MCLSCSISVVIVKHLIKVAGSVWNQTSLSQHYTAVFHTFKLGAISKPRGLQSFATNNQTRFFSSESLSFFLPSVIYPHLIPYLTNVLDPEQTTDEDIYIYIPSSGSLFNSEASDTRYFHTSIWQNFIEEGTKGKMLPSPLLFPVTWVPSLPADWI